MDRALPLDSWMPVAPGRCSRGMSTTNKSAIELTPREHEVAVALALGFKCREIADTLKLSTKTVDTHRMHLLKKLGLRNAVELARHALRVGWVTL